jgi:predicted secreted hydrolase
LVISLGARLAGFGFGLAWAAAALADAPPPVEWPVVEPGRAIEFPRDEGAHPEHRIEWWYVTGWLEDEPGAAQAKEPFGFQVTFFRVRPGFAEQNPSRFAPAQILFAHAALAEPTHGKLRHGQRSARAGFGLAEARAGRTEVFIDDWSLVQQGDRYRARVGGEGFAFELELTRMQSPLLQGQGGFSRKGPEPDAASHYYSLPQLAVRGTVTSAGRARPVTGQAWLDHEWSSQYVGSGAVGWDWIGVNLADGGALMAFRMRKPDGSAHWAGATLRNADGSVRSFGPDAVEWTAGRRWRSPRSGASYPVEWQLRVGATRYTLEPLFDDAELDSRASTGTIYWEGPLRLRDAASRRELGRGYLELTGYAGELRL